MSEPDQKKMSGFSFETGTGTVAAKMSDPTTASYRILYDSIGFRQNPIVYLVSRHAPNPNVWVRCHTFEFGFGHIPSGSLDTSRTRTYMTELEPERIPFGTEPRTLGFGPCLIV
jgi:hypothetical protein